MKQIYVIMVFQKIWTVRSIEVPYDSRVYIICLKAKCGFSLNIYCLKDPPPCEMFEGKAQTSKI